MALIHTEKESFEQDVLKSEKPVLVDFWATWCGPCRMIAPSLEEIAAERDDITVCKIDVDKDTELAITYGISSIPALLLFQNGEVAARTVGAMPKELLLEFVDSNLH